MSENKKVDKNEMSNRIREVQEYILQGQLTCDIIKQLCLKYEIKERQAYIIYNRAWTELQEISKQEKEKKKNIYLQMMRKTFRDLKYKETPSGARAAQRIIEGMARIDGIIPIRENMKGFESGFDDDESNGAVIKLSDGTEIEI